MTISMNSEKITNIRQWCTFLIESKYYKIKLVAKVVGILVSCLPGV